MVLLVLLMLCLFLVSISRSRLFQGHQLLNLDVPRERNSMNTKSYYGPGWYVLMTSLTISGILLLSNTIQIYSNEVNLEVELEDESTQLKKNENFPSKNFSDSGQFSNSPTSDRSHSVRRSNSACSI